MKFLIHILILSFSILATAEDQMQVTIINDVQGLQINSVQVVYESDNTFVCGEFDEGSIVSKKKYKNLEIKNGSVSFAKSFTSKFCTYMASGLIVKANNPYEWETDYAELAFVNSFNQEFFEDRNNYDSNLDQNYVAYNCKHSKEEYGCFSDNDFTSIANDEITVYLGK